METKSLNRFLTKRVVILATCVLSCVAASAASEYSIEMGAPEYSVKEMELVRIHDQARNKELELRIYYPQGDGPFPVVIFSHGNTSSKDQYPLVGGFLAGSGFVSIHPTHSDSIRYWDGKRDRAKWARKSMWDQDRWTSRPRDVSFIIDSLAEIERKCPELRLKHDTVRIAVAGHSFGGNTAQLIGGARPRVEGEKELASFRDSRVKAIVALSAAGRGWVGMQDESWDELKVPMLSVTGTNDFGPEGRFYDFRLEPFLFCPPGDKYQLIVQDMGHDFRREPSEFEVVGLVLRAFLDAYLLNSHEAGEYLKSGELRRSSDGNALLSWR